VVCFIPFAELGLHSNLFFNLDGYTEIQYTKNLF